MQYKLTNNEGVETLTIFDPVEFDFKTVTSVNPNFEDILRGVRNDDVSVFGLISPEQAISRKFESLSQNVTVANGAVFYDGDPVDAVLTDKIIDYYQSGVEDWKPLVAFAEKLYTNIDANTRDNLFRWLANEGLTITQDGNILGYKGLNNDLTSKTAGPGIVNGVETVGNLDNSVGNVLEMARSQVTNDPSIGCASGLHVGTRAYATDFAGYDGKLVVVEVDPRNVVSVPYDCNDQKMRVSKYKVLEEAAPEYSVIYTAPVGFDLDSAEGYDELDDEDEDDFYNDDCFSGHADCNCRADYNNS